MRGSVNYVESSVKRNDWAITYFHTTCVGWKAEVKQLLLLSVPGGVRQVTKVFPHRLLYCWQQELSTAIYHQDYVPEEWSEAEIAHLRGPLQI